MKTLTTTLLSFFCFFCVSSLSTQLMAQKASPSMKMWENMLDEPELAKYFEGVFDHLGIEIPESNEAFTVHHKGNTFSLTNGIDKNVDYTIQLKLKDIESMKAFGKDKKIDADESYQIVAVLFTPMTAASLENPMMSKPMTRKLAGVENHIHIYLTGPDKKDINAHTLVYVNKKWVVIQGIHGEAKRVFRMTPDEALNYQRQVFKAIKANSGKGWRVFRKWYMKWRDTFSVVK